VHKSRRRANHLGSTSRQFDWRSQRKFSWPCRMADGRSWLDRSSSCFLFARIGCIPFPSRSGIRRSSSWTAYGHESGRGRSALNAGVCLVIHHDWTFSSDRSISIQVSRLGINRRRWFHHGSAWCDFLDSVALAGPVVPRVGGRGFANPAGLVVNHVRPWIAQFADAETQASRSLWERPKSVS
jgi:hypothetical protein